MKGTHDAHVCHNFYKNRPRRTLSRLPKLVLYASSMTRNSTWDTNLYWTVQSWVWTRRVAKEWEGWILVWVKIHLVWGKWWVTLKGNSVFNLNAILHWWRRFRVNKIDEMGLRLATRREIGWRLRKITRAGSYCKSVIMIVNEIK